MQKAHLQGSPSCDFVFFVIKLTAKHRACRFDNRRGNARVGVGEQE